MRPRHLLVVAVGLLTLPGCGPGKLNVNQEVTLDAQKTATAIQLDKQKKPQNITVEFDSSDGDVTVLLFKAEDMEKGDDGPIMTPDSKAQAKKRGQKESFTAELPANTDGAVVIRGSNKAKTTVKVHITN
jgi:hypothetical protein